MSTVLLRLAGPMQSWGTRSRFDERDTEMEPSKSGVLGLICAALGRDRSESVEDLRRLRMGVRVDRQGIFRADFQTAQNVIAADGKKVHPTAVSTRHYLADAVFLVGLEGEDRGLLAGIDRALRNPHWPLSLGRKSYVPSLPVFLDPETERGGVVDGPLEETLAACPPLAEDSRPSVAQETPASKRYRYVLEDADRTGALRMDQPIEPFAARRFGARYVRAIAADPGEVPDVSV